MKVVIGWEDIWIIIVVATIKVVGRGGEKQLEGCFESRTRRNLIFSQECPSVWRASVCRWITRSWSPPPLTPPSMWISMSRSWTSSRSMTRSSQYPWACTSGNMQTLLAGYCIQICLTTINLSLIDFWLEANIFIAVWCGASTGSGQTTAWSLTSGTRSPWSSSRTSGSPMCSSTTSRASPVSKCSKDWQVRSSIEYNCQATGTGTWDLGLGTWDLGLGTWDLRPGTWDLGIE